MTTLVAGFGAVAGAVASSFIVHHIYMPVRVMQARKQYKVKYPDLYATAENCEDVKSRSAFNCVQRGHQNSLENQPIFLALLLTAGTQNPLTSAALGLVYCIGKVLYMQGYATGKPEKRMNGSVAYIGLFGLLGICIKMAVITAKATI